MPKGPKNNKGKEVCRRTITSDSNVPYAGEGRRGYHEPRREQLRVVQPDGQWFEPPLLHDGRHGNPGNVHTVQVLESEPSDQTHIERRQRKAQSSSTTLPTATPASAPIVVRPPPCPCTTRTLGATQEVLSGLLLVIRQQAMQLQCQIMQKTHGYLRTSRT